MNLTKTLLLRDRESSIQLDIDSSIQLLHPFCRLLDKLMVTCPNSDSCDELLQRGLLGDHLRYRCSGTMVACQFAGAGCDFRGPAKKMSAHQAECSFKEEGKKLSYMRI